MKSGFWQIQIRDSDRYKAAFTTPFGHYEWNVMPFGLKNAPSKFQNIMNEIFNPFSSFAIVYIDDVLIFSESLNQHRKHLRAFLQTVRLNGLVVSAPKIKLFQTRVRFLGFDIHHGVIKPIDRAIQFVDKFPDQILDKTQLRRFLGSLNYISDFYQNLRQQCKPLFDKLWNNPSPWTPAHTSVVQEIKKYVKTLHCLGILSVNSFKIVQTDASNIGYGGILLQHVSPNSPKQIVCFHSGIWTPTQLNYSTIKKEILFIVLCISQFQSDLLNQKFLIRIDCKSAKHVLEKDVQNIASKQIFARWQAILSVFDFDIEFIKGTQNSIPNFLTREFLQSPNHNVGKKDTATLTATPRLPKQCPPTRGSTSQAKNPTSQLVPLPPSTLVNQYLVSTIPKPNYQRPSLSQPSYSSALVSPAPKAVTPYTVEVPFGPIQSQKPSSSSSRKGRSPYIIKPFVQHISYIEPNLVHIKDPLALDIEVLPEGWHFLPKHPEKNIKFYKSILIQEQFA